MTFGEKLQKLRKAKGWTQEDLASQISISRQALSKWELERQSPIQRMSYRLEKFLVCLRITF